MNWSSGYKAVVRGRVTRLPVMTLTGKEGHEQYVTGFSIKVDTEISAYPVTLQVWEAKDKNTVSLAIVELVKRKGQRVVAVGEPADTIYAAKMAIQRQVSLKELYVEDESHKFVAVMLPSGRAEEDMTDDGPIEMPELMSVL